MSEVSSIKGEAFYRERIALPPGAVFEAVLEDISRQDVEAREIGRFEGKDAMGPPFSFSIDYDSKEIDQRNTYAVRASIRLEGRLKFTSDTVHPVLTWGAGSEIRIMMRMVVEQPLQPGPEMASSIMGGEVSVDGGGTYFTDAVTGKRRELVDGGDYDKLMAAYEQAAVGDGRALYFTFEGRVGENGRITITRFINAWPNQSNERSRSDAALTNTYWRIVSMMGEKVGTINARKEPHIMLKEVDGQRRFSATVGCNQLVGGYSSDGDNLTFSMMATTLMACMPPLDAMERTLTTVLAESKRYVIKGQTLELYDMGGNSIALLETVYL